MKGSFLNLLSPISVWKIEDTLRCTFRVDGRRPKEWPDSLEQQGGKGIPVGRETGALTWAEAEQRGMEPQESWGWGG